MKVEVFRELGEFDSPLEVLSRLTAWEVVSEVRQVRSLCEKKKVCVHELLIQEATCPFCDKPLSTPSARQCRFCGADWHE